MHTQCACDLRVCDTKHHISFCNCKNGAFGPLCSATLQNVMNDITDMHALCGHVEFLPVTMHDEIGIRMAAIGNITSSKFQEQQTTFQQNGQATHPGTLQETAPESLHSNIQLECHDSRAVAGCDSRAVAGSVAWIVPGSDVGHSHDKRM